MPTCKHGAVVGYCDFCQKEEAAKKQKQEKEKKK